MAVITATFVQTSFKLSSGALVVKIKAPATIGVTKLAAVPIISKNIQRGRVNPTTPVESVATFVPGFYDALWKNKSHLQVGDALTGWTENPVLALGNILTQQDRNFQIYNAREKAPVRVVSLVLDNADGISVDDPVQPDFINNRTPKVYQLTVSSDGPPVINATATVTTDAGEVFVVRITGTRTIVVPFMPQKRVRESIAYKTWIATHKDGTEQRQGFRDVAMQGLTYEYLNAEQLSSYVENFFYLRGGALFGVPYVPGSTSLDGDAIAGALSFDVKDAADKGLREGNNEALGLLWLDEFTFEAVQIASIVGNTINIVQELLATWPDGTQFFPLRRAYASAPQQKAAMRRVRTYTTTFAVVANEETPDNSSFATFDGLPVWEDLQLARGIIDRNFDSRLSVFNPETAQRDQWTDVRSPQMSWGFFRKFERLADFFTFRNFYMDRHGRQLPFWIRTALDDFQVLLDQAAGVIIVVKNVEAAQMFDANTSLRRRQLAIQYADGSIDYRTISGITQISDDREDITITAASSQALSAANVFQISWLVKVRFAVDTIDVTHIQRQQSQVAFTLTDLDE